MMPAVFTRMAPGNHPSLVGANDIRGRALALAAGRTVAARSGLLPTEEAYS